MTVFPPGSSDEGQGVAVLVRWGLCFSSHDDASSSGHIPDQRTWCVVFLVPGLLHIMALGRASSRRETKLKHWQTRWGRPLWRRLSTTGPWCPQQPSAGGWGWDDTGDGGRDGHGTGNTPFVMAEYDSHRPQWLGSMLFPLASLTRLAVWEKLASPSSEASVATDTPGGLSLATRLLKPWEAYTSYRGSVTAIIWKADSVRMNVSEEPPC